MLFSKEMFNVIFQSARDKIDVMLFIKKNYDQFIFPNTSDLFILQSLNPLNVVALQIPI
jgi:hypothetical protein